MEPVTALSVGIQPYPNHIHKIAQYGSVTGLAPTKLVPTETIFVQPPDGNPNSSTDLQREDMPINNEKSLQIILTKLQAHGYTADSAPPLIKAITAPMVAAKPFRVSLANTGSKANTVGKKKAKNVPKTPASGPCAPKLSILTGTSNTSCTSQKKTFDQLLSNKLSMCYSHIAITLMTQF
jgi:hypothetical protein